MLYQNNNTVICLFNDIYYIIYKIIINKIVLILYNIMYKKSCFIDLLTYF